MEWVRWQKTLLMKASEGTGDIIQQTKHSSPVSCLLEPELGEVLGIVVPEDGADDGFGAEREIMARVILLNEGFYGSVWGTGFVVFPSVVFFTIGLGGLFWGSGRVADMASGVDYTIGGVSTKVLFSSGKTFVSFTQWDATKVVKDTRYNEGNTPGLMLAKATVAKRVVDSRHQEVDDTSTEITKPSSQGIGGPEDTFVEGTSRLYLTRDEASTKDSDDEAKVGTAPASRHPAKVILDPKRSQYGPVISLTISLSTIYSDPLSHEPLRLACVAISAIIFEFTTWKGIMWRSPAIKSARRGGNAVYLD
ncbi:uncharacterized protein BDR25DRAFT_359256 [Lindgomyces ingoldianus]|uniref:Uncharacterized protein n=1 Tax=Lindgomyces ingoldianus TaxID=673940 RepID=A0ACB6QJJ4_9PLEO|nr:uncharacterized protein BDR25DRAFT_359256 [Lindgomyces ingoldianus]KAF2466748.1 hypothetical protein BDR25DRAFT_359256 [Lindgomyces ingoldianus]